MAAEAEGAEIVQVAFAAASGDGENVVGVPEGPAVGEKCGALRAGQAAEAAVLGDRVETAEGADAAVAREDLVTEVARVRPETPLVHAVRRAEGPAAARRHLQGAPAAEGAAVRAGREGRGVHEAAGHAPGGARRAAIHSATPPGRAPEA